MAFNVTGTHGSQNFRHVPPAAMKLAPAQQVRRITRRTIIKPKVRSMTGNADRMRIVVTGATGFVGRNLVPLLSAAGAELLLVGRDEARVEAAFPGYPACAYGDLAARATGFDTLVHLAVANNDADLPDQAFRQANVEFLLHTAQSARKAGIRRFVNVSSFHALDAGNRTAYAESKREGVQRLASVDGIETQTVYLPAVHGDGWSGRLGFLNRLPRPVARALFVPLAALRPTAHVSRLAAFLLHPEADLQDEDVLLSDGQRENFFYRAVARTVDLSFALGVVLLLWWLLALLWLAVRLQSPGPGIFAQRRVGRNGAEFTCYKFRTMKAGTVEAATNEVPAEAVTGIGRFLRRTKLDELPQVWNILRNEIGLVGPRPCLPVQTQLVEARRRRGVLSLKPGMTGLAQVNGIDMSDPERLARWDRRYLALQSLALDARIVLATARGRGQGDRVADGG